MHRLVTAPRARWWVRLSIPLATGCGVENKLGGDTDPPATPLIEVCNGVDDDGNGAVDDGFADTDANGVADCVEATCPELKLGAAGPVAGDPTCAGLDVAPVADPWALEMLWEVPLPELSVEEGEATLVMSQPLVSQLEDSNGDGMVDGGDDPEVVFFSYTTNWNSSNVFQELHIVNGSTGSPRLTTTMGANYPMLDLGLAELTPGLGTEIFVSDPEMIYPNPLTLDASGETVWRSDAIGEHRAYAPVFADLDEDGDNEVVNFSQVLDAATGKLLFELPFQSPYSAVGGTAAVADVDLDGDQEVFLDFRAYDSDGSVLWDGYDGPEDQYRIMCYPFILQADADREAEVGFLGNSMAIYDTDGTPIVEQVEPYDPWDAVFAYAPCVGDLDGDGWSDVAWSLTNKAVAYRSDGTQLWSTELQTGDHAGGIMQGCSTFDFDGDGAAEVLIASIVDFYILDGATGVILATWSPYVVNNNPILYPSVVDVNGDGAADVLLAGAGYTNDEGGRIELDATGWLTALTNPGWPPVGSHWPSHDFSVTNMGVAGEIPTHPEPFWLTHGVYRGRTPGDLPPARANLRVSIPDACIADCTNGPVMVAVQVSNDGARDVGAGVPVSLYALDGSTRRVVGTAILPAVPAGASLDGIQFDLRPEDVGTDGFLAVVDDDGTGEPSVWECHEDDNTATWTEGCPAGG